MNAFLDYAQDTLKKQRPAPLTGPIKTRAEARLAYNEIVAEIASCDDRDTLDIYLMTIGEQLLQFETELPFLWEGDGSDFIGLDNEVKNAIARLSDNRDRR